MKKFIIMIIRNIFGFNKSFFIKKSIQLKFPNVYIASSVIIHKGTDTLLSLDKNCSIGHYTVISIENDSLHPNQIKSKLIIGADTYIGEHNNIRAAGGIIQIGKKCLISQNVSLIASNHSYNLGKYIKDQEWEKLKTGIIIGDDVWIGCNSVILPGTIIGNGTIIGAGSIVKNKVPSNAIFAGNPAKLIKYRT